MNHGRIAIIILLWIIGSTPMAVADVTDQEVGRAIEKMKRFFYEKQDPKTGSWEFRSATPGLDDYRDQAGGETALVVQALLVSGESFQNPKISAALDFLRQKTVTLSAPGAEQENTLELFHGTYAVAVRAHVWSYLPPEFMPMLEKDAKWLLLSAKKHRLGLFGYHPNDVTRIDHSASQYGMLGLWQASKRGFKVPKRYWERWVDHFIGAQVADGGWNYGSAAINPAVSDGLTTAGLTALNVGQQELYRTKKKPEPKITESIAGGMTWLQQHFQGIENPNGGGAYNYYYIYGIERVALMTGVRQLNHRDWYQTCATEIVKSLTEDGSVNEGYIDTAFALMFLARGRYPVWINKIEVPGTNWRNYPNDLYFLCHYLSDQREGEVNWQVADINTEPEGWLTAPVAYLSSNRPVALTDPQKKSLKRYIDLGGLLVTTADQNSSAFSDSIRELARELYPDYKIEPLGKDHELYNAWHRITNPARYPLSSLSNGARDLIIMSESDWGHTLQSDTKRDSDPVWKLATNIFAYATDKGVLNNRLVSPLIARERRSPSGSMTVGRARYAGNWLPEPAAWQMLADFAFNRTGIKITTTPERDTDPADLPENAAVEEAQTLDLDQIGASNLPLIHLTGTDTVVLNPGQLNAIRDYAKRGGTLVVETVGGHGQFSQAIETQLTSHLSSPAVPLTGADPVISGKGLGNGFNNRRALYRRYAVLKLNVEAKPYLSAFMVDDRPAIIISHDDLSLGMLGSRQWDILGYQTQSSREIMTNIILWANGQQIAAAN